MVKRFWFSAPIDRPTVAMMTSVEPRAFMPQASAKPSRRVRPPSFGAEEAPPNLADAGDHDQADGEQAHGRVEERAEIALKPATRRTHGAKKAGDHAAQLLVDMAGEDWGFADQNAGDEGAQYRVHADKMRDRRHRPMMTRMAVTTAKSLSKLSFTQRMMKNTARRPNVKLTTMKASCR